ncbi:MAG TPA: hypothetical protein VGL03_14680 [Thermoanaerobaculia bacterium]|jgi:outer membrane lipoprotein-sorting protein
MDKLGIALTAAVLLAASPAAPTADEVIQRNIEARGGLAKIKSVQSMRLTGTMSVEGQDMLSTLEIKRPNKTRWEFTVEGATAVQAYDGKTGWTVMPFAGKTEPESMSADDLKDIELQADMDGPLVGYKAKGNRVELVGRERVGEREAWRLRVTLTNGDVREIYLDVKTNLQFLTVTRRTIEGKEMEVESEIGDYRDVNGVLLPHSFEARAKGASQKQTLKFDKIELNVPIDDSRFRMPESKKPVEKPDPAPAVS